MGSYNTAMVTKTTSATKPNKQHQANLRESQEFARALIQSAGTGIYVIQEGKFQYVNYICSEITGYTREELIRKYPLGLVHPDDRDMVRTKAIDALKTHSTSPYEYRIIKKTGG